MQKLTDRMFDRLLVHEYMGLLFIVGVAAICLASLTVSIENLQNINPRLDISQSQEPQFHFFRFMFFAVGGSIVWRIWCEVTVILFLIHGKLQQLTERPGEAAASDS